MVLRLAFQLFRQSADEWHGHKRETSALAQIRSQLDTLLQQPPAAVVTSIPRTVTHPLTVSTDNGSSNVLSSIKQHLSDVPMQSTDCTPSCLVTGVISPDHSLTRVNKFLRLDRVESPAAISTSLNSENSHERARLQVYY